MCNSRFFSGVCNSMVILSAAALIQAGAVTASAATLADWQNQEKAWSQDAATVRLYPFDPADDQLVNIAGKKVGTLTVLTPDIYNNPAAQVVSVASADLPRWTAGRWKGKSALSFGRADYAAIRSRFYNTGTSALTVEAWVRTHLDAPAHHQVATVCGVAAPRNSTLFAGRADYRGGWRLLTTGDEAAQLRLERTSEEGGPVVIKGGAPLTDHGWHHMVAVIDRNSATIFVDGQVIATQSFTGYYRQPSAPTGDMARNPEVDMGGLQIGGSFSANTTAFRFDLDALALYSRPLSADEVSRHFQSGRPESSAEKQAAEYQAAQARWAREDAVTIQLPVDTRGYFVRQTQVALAISVDGRSGLSAGGYVMDWILQNRENKAIATGHKLFDLSAGKTESFTCPVTMPERCDLYTLKVVISTASGDVIHSRDFPLAVRIPAPAAGAPFALATHEATSRHYETLRLGSSCERMIVASNWFPTRRPDGSRDYSGVERRMAMLEPLGISMLLCYEPISYVPKTPEEKAECLRRYEDDLRQVVAHFKGRIAYYEVGNEPNASGGGRGSAPIPYYVELLKIAHRVVHEQDPQAKVLGPCTVGDYPAWIDDVLALGGGEYIDILSFHNYLSDSPLRQMRTEQKITKVRASMRRYLGRELPMWNSESGFWQPARINGHAMTDAQMSDLYQDRLQQDADVVMARVDGIRMVTEHRAAAWQVQSTLLDFTQNVERYFLLMGPNNYYCLPNSTWGLPSEKGLAWAAMASALMDMKSVTLNAAASDRLAMLDIRDTHGRRNVVLFADEASTVTLKAPAGTVLEGYDYLGNSLRFPMADNGVMTLPVAMEPVYLLDVPSDLTPIRLLNVSEFPANLSPQQKADGRITVENPLSRTIRGELQLFAKGCAVTMNPDITLAPGEKKKVPFTLTAGQLCRGDQSLTVALVDGRRVLASTQHAFKSEGVARPIARVRHPIVLDGNDADWAGISAETANSINQVAVGRPRIGFMDQDGWVGPDDLSFRFQTAWNNDGLYFLITVKDDQLKTAPPELLERAFLWDCIEFFFDGRPLSENQAPLTTGAEQLVIVPATSSSVQPCAMHSFSRTPGTFDIQTVGKATSDGYVIEGVIRPNAKSAFHLTPGQRLGLSIGVDDAGSKPGERKSQMMLYGNAGNGHDTTHWGRYELHDDRQP